VLGLAGFGKIPQNLCFKAKALGLEVIAYDPFLSEEIARQHQVMLVDLDTLCRDSDFISVHTPLTSATRGLIGQPQFHLMKPDAVIINTSRGPIIDEAQLILALQASRIAGAALDVLQEEPIKPDSPLLTMDQVILTPHIAWYSEQSEQEMRTKVTQNIVDVLSGYYPVYLENPDVKQNVTLQTQSE
jgi:D-3-phosphoglycerate dehydrogenase